MRRMISPTVKIPHTAASPSSKGVHVQVITTPRQIATLFGNPGNSRIRRPTTAFEIPQSPNGNYYRPTWQAPPEESRIWPHPCLAIRGCDAQCPGSIQMTEGGALVV